MRPHPNLVSCEAADAWNTLTVEEKLPYTLLAAQEKSEHRQKYPNCVFMPTGNATKRGARRSSKPYSLPAKKSSKRSKAKDAAMPLNVSTPALAPSFEQQILGPSADFILPEPMLSHYPTQHYIPVSR